MVVSGLVGWWGFESPKASRVFQTVSSILTYGRAPGCARLLHNDVELASMYRNLRKGS